MISTQLNGDYSTLSRWCREGIFPLTDPTIVELFERNRDSFTTLNHNQTTWLHTAAHEGNIPLLFLAAKQGAMHEIRDSHGKTVKEICGVRWEMVEALQKIPLIAQRAFSQEKLPCSKTFELNFLHAILSQNTNDLKKITDAHDPLIRAPFFVDQNGQLIDSFLHFAVEEGKLTSTIYLIQTLLFSPVERNAKGETPFLVAVRKNETAMVLWFITKKWAPNEPDYEGNYPIHHAIKNNNLFLVTALWAGDQKIFHIPSLQKEYLLTLALTPEMRSVIALAL